MKSGILGLALARVICSLLCAGILYSGWMAVFILVEPDDPVLKAIIWLLAPIVTAAGFAVGVVIFDRLSKMGKTGLFRIFFWSMPGCAIGAGSVYWFGPMLIVFGMFVAGTLSVTLRELVIITKTRRTG